jgi:hypothetical protein
MWPTAAVSPIIWTMIKVLHPRFSAAIEDSNRSHGAGVPVATISFTGTASVVDETAVWPIEFDLTEFSDTCPPNPKGFEWLDPCISSFAHQM